MSAADLARLLRPRSIAAVGGKPAAEVVRQLHRLGYDGAIWPVHRDLETLEGLPVHRSLAALPAPPDAVFLAVNRHRTVELVGELAAIGAGGAVAYASGFAETGAEGAALQRALIEAAGAMPVIGPNCYGLLNYLDGAALWPDQHGGLRCGRGVAVVTQSGNIACNITMQRRALPLGYVVTLGNQAVVGLSAAIAALAEDPRVSAIGLHIEGFDDAAGFAAAVAMARDRGKPVVALKAGGSAAGARLAVSHTAALGGADAVADAYLRRLGVARVPSLPVLLETLKLLHFCGKLPGRTLVSMSCSGGEAALVADRAEGRRICLRPFTPAQHAAVAATVAPLVSVSNPFDYHTFAWADRAALEATFTAVLRCDYDLAALILDYPRTDRCAEADWLAASDALAGARRATGRPAAIIATLPECLPEPRAAELAAAGVVPLLGLDDALAAIEAAADLGTHRRAPPPVGGRAPAGRARLLDEAAAKQALAAHGVAVPAGRVIRSVAEAGAAAAALGWPVVLKALGLAHKTEQDAVRLGLADAPALAAAAAELAPRAASLLVERMVTDGVAEVIVGVARDPALGPYLVLGAGGVLAELAADRAILMLPAAAGAIRAALDGLRVGALLRGHRGRPAGNIEALVQAIEGVQAYALAALPRLVELDVNPIIVTPRGAVAVDALIRLAEEDA